MRAKQAAGTPWPFPQVTDPVNGPTAEAKKNGGGEEASKKK
jgi:hypothetical protein